VSLRRIRDDEDSFRQFAAGAVGPLGRLAFLLCGDTHLAQDLVQVCLIKMYRVWNRIERRPETADAYVRQVLTRCWLNERRRPWRRSESGDGRVPDLPDARSDPALGVGSAEVTDLLRLALAEIPPRQRAAVVFRYWSQLSVTETAAVMRCSEGTVKSQTARGLAALRTAVTRHGGDAALLSEMSSR
jgi:RNA polymerase sigma-70 factor (sigma-E family)